MSPRLTTLLLSSALAAGLAAPAAAQTEPAPAAANDAEPVIAPGDTIEFAADTMDYDDDTQIVTARGNVVVTRDGYRLSANEVAYDRKAGTVEARGAVKIIDPDGNEAFGERVQLDESLRDGAVENFLLVLQDGGRLAAQGGQREGGRTTVNRAVYSPCDIIGEDGCPKEPLWQVKALRVRHDPDRKRVYYKDASLEFLGIPIFYTPSLSHPDGPGRNATGILVPSLTIDRSLGVSVELPYFLSLSESNDLTIAPIIYTEVNPALSVEYRHQTASGPIRLGGIGTYSSELDFSDSDPTSAGIARKQFRGYAYGNGQLQHSPNWRSTFGFRIASDDTFLRRYDISRDDTLRNFYRAERFDVESYFAVEGWAFQGLRQADVPGLTPIALPLMTYMWSPTDTLAGGRLKLAADTAAITRTDGMDTQRASASAEWRRSALTPWGQRVSLTGLLRADIYHVSDSALAELPIYAGRDGWRGRVLPAAALDIEWPLAGPALGGIQTLTPRVQFVASPDNADDGIPNEDARAVDLDDTNLFDLNRFPGYDRWEGGQRVTYGFNWRLDRPRWQVESEFGQSYRFDDPSRVFPTGTGLSGNFSDFVGRNTVRIGGGFDLTHRFRLDKTSLKLRRNEVDVTIGNKRTYATLGYVKLNRDIGIEDLSDREEARAGGRLSFARYWSVIGSVIVDLTSRAEDPLNASDGLEMVRHRLGIAYQDDCFEFGVTWRRDYVEDRDFRRGNAFLFSISLKNLGR